MSTRTVQIVAPEGLHARPAAEFARAAAAAGVPVRLKFGDKEVNAASILGVLSLGVTQGSEITLSSDAADSDAALDGLVALLESQHA